MADEREIRRREKRREARVSSRKKRQAEQDKKGRRTRKPLQAGADRIGRKPLRGGFKRKKRAELNASAKTPSRRTRRGRRSGGSGRPSRTARRVGAIDRFRTKKQQEAAAQPPAAPPVAPPVTSQPAGQNPPAPAPPPAAPPVAPPPAPAAPPVAPPPVAAPPVAPPPAPVAPVPGAPAVAPPAPVNPATPATTGPGSQPAAPPPVAPVVATPEISGVTPQVDPKTGQPIVQPQAPPPIVSGVDPTLGTDPQAELSVAPNPLLGTPVTPEEQKAQAQLDVAFDQGKQFDLEQGRPQQADPATFYQDVRLGNATGLTNPRDIERIRRKRLALMDPRVQQLRKFGRGLPQIRFGQQGAVQPTTLDEFNPTNASDIAVR